MQGLLRDYNYFAAAGGVSLDVSILWVSVVVLVPSGVVTVVSFLISAFLSQPTVNGTTRLKAKQRVKNRFIIENSSIWRDRQVPDLLACPLRNRDDTQQG
jgi:hypothetical protein